VTLKGHLRALLRGADYITLDPSPRLRRLREQQQAERPAPLPPLPESAYTPGGALLEPREAPPFRPPWKPPGRAS
jgi:hypothetical protein